jgi:hypothetical protein
MPTVRIRGQRDIFLGLAAAESEWLLGCLEVKRSAAISECRRDGKFATFPFCSRVGVVQPVSAHPSIPQSTCRWPLALQLVWHRWDGRGEEVMPMHP